MTAKEAFQIWAPTGQKWVDWVRPVPFVGMTEYSKGYQFSNFTVPTIDCIDESGKDTAIIVDLPGVESVKTGLALAKIGFRPIPVFNGTIEQQGARATVDNQAVGIALMWGAEELSKIEISDHAMPVFLVDSNRLHRYKMEAPIFDNSWDLYAQDIPSAEYFKKNGICNIIVIGDALAIDLKIILYGFQKKEMKIFLTNGYEEPKKLKIHKPIRKERD